MRKSTIRDYEPADYPKFDVGIENIKDDIDALKKENDKLSLNYDIILWWVIVMAIWLVFFTAYLIIKTR